jgi:hypothetical protein
MASGSPRDKNAPVEVESAERWVSGKTEEELLSDLKVYSARLREDPHGIQDRLRVAAIQLRLGRIGEALIHYEGVLREYVGRDQVMSAIALCRRILSIYPNIPRLQRILAALYARVPHREHLGPRPVTPIEQSADQPFVLHEGQADDGVVVDRLFSDGSMSSRPAASRDLLDGEDLRPTLPFHSDGEAGPPHLLTQRKHGRERVAEPEDDGVVLLTKKKK